MTNRCLPATGFNVESFCLALKAAASDLDDATKQQLANGKAFTELLKQKQYAPMSVAQQALSLFAADRGDMADVEVEIILDF